MASVQSNVSLATSKQLTADDIAFIGEFILLDCTRWSPSDVSVKKELSQAYKEVKEECEQVPAVVGLTPVFGSLGSGPRPRSRHYICPEPLCGRVFFRTDSLKRHREEHARGSSSTKKKRYGLTVHGMLIFY